MSIARIFITSGEKVRREATQAARSGSESCIKSEGDRRWFTGADALVVWHSVCGGRWGRGRGRGGEGPCQPAGRIERSALCFGWIAADVIPSMCLFSLSLSRSPPLFFPRISLRARFISDRRSARKSIFSMAAKHAPRGHRREIRPRAIENKHARKSLTRAERYTLNMHIYRGKSLYPGYKITVSRSSFKIW